MKTRTIKPEANNKYYIRLENGGWSPAIKGRPTDSDCNILSNCVGYVIGRFNEILEMNECKYLKSVMAKKMIEANPDLETGYLPKVGSVMVWKSTNNGHCAIVEKVINENEVITSESFYGGLAFANVHRKREDDWGSRSNQSFLAFIYSPKEIVLEDTTNEADILEASELNKGGDSYEFSKQFPKYFGSHESKIRLQTRQRRSKRYLRFKNGSFFKNR